MELLELLNPWWKGKGISKELAPDYRRKVFQDIRRHLEVRQVTVISGLRRVGKSTAMYQLIEDLLKDVKPENILYFSFDEKKERLEDVLEEYSALTGVDWHKEKCFVFFDEIQKLEGWSGRLKMIYDSHPNLKMVVSGSASFQLEKEAKSNLVGRHFVVNMEPLSFEEFLELKGSRIDTKKPKLWEDEIKREFEDYLFRPLPEIVDLKEMSLVKTYIKDSVMDRVLRIDLSERFGRLNEELLTRLIGLFYENPGMYVNYDELSKELGVGKKTLLKHIYYLEFAYIIRRIRNFRPRERTTSRKLQRVYPYHFVLMFGWTGRTDFETVVASRLDAKYYWRKGGKEVDFLLVNEGIIPVEVKESRKVRKSELRSLFYFMERFEVQEGLVVYKGKEGRLEADGLVVKKLPLWKLFLDEPAHSEDVL